MAPNKKQDGCAHCRDCNRLDIDITFAFQPIVDVGRGEVFAYEALVRGTGGESAGEILAQVTPDNRYAFDQACRVKAVELAAKLRMDTRLSINFMPNAVYRPELCIRSTIAAAERFGFPISQIIFEVTETERVDDGSHLRAILSHYQQVGFQTAIDDFGSGYAGLSLLADFQPDLIKLDMGLVRDVDRSGAKQTIARNLVSLCRELDIALVAEGVETVAEFDFCRSLGIALFQGYLFARPALEALPGWSHANMANHRQPSVA